MPLDSEWIAKEVASGFRAKGPFGETTFPAAVAFAEKASPAVFAFAKEESPALTAAVAEKTFPAAVAYAEEASPASTAAVAEEAHLAVTAFAEKASPAEIAFAGEASPFLDVAAFAEEAFLAAAEEAFLAVVGSFVKEAFPAAEVKEVAAFELAIAVAAEDVVTLTVSSRLARTVAWADSFETDRQSNAWPWRIRVCPTDYQWVHPPSSK